MPSTSTTSTLDICLGSSSRDAGAQVLVTVTDQKSADAIVTALKGASLYQCDGLRPFARAVERGEPVVAAPATKDAPVDATAGG